MYIVLSTAHHSGTASWPPFSFRCVVSSSRQLKRHFIGICLRFNADDWHRTTIKQQQNNAMTAMPIGKSRIPRTNVAMNCAISSISIVNMSFSISFTRSQFTFFFRSLLCWLLLLLLLRKEANRFREVHVSILFYAQFQNWDAIITRAPKRTIPTN